MSEEEKKDNEELDEENVEVEADTKFNLYWTCPNCQNDNEEYDIPLDGLIECICDKCFNTYKYYHCIY